MISLEWVWVTALLYCPVSATSVSESWFIVVTAVDTLPERNSCSISSDTVAYDCSSLAEDDCVIRDCDGSCTTTSDGAGGGVGGGGKQCSWLV